MKKSLAISTCLILLAVLLATSGFAANGEPLKLESSNPENGAVDIATDLTEIDLKFSKNVVNMKVAENNKTCIDFVDGDGNSVPFELIMSDDQVDREKRDFLYIKPKEALAEGTTYIVKISKDLTSKSGTALEEALEVSFTTVGGTPVAEEIADESTDGSLNYGLTWIGIIALFFAGFIMFSHKKKS